MGADSSDTHLKWLGSLHEAGVRVLPEADEVEGLVKHAKSIFEFEAQSIDGDLVDLSRYR